MCSNLLQKSGCSVICHDLAREPVEALAREGATPAASVDELADRASIVFLCLASAQAVEQVVDRLLVQWERCQGARVVVDMGTTSLATTQRIAERLAQAGHRFIDAPVARMPAAAVEGTLSIMVGGSAHDLAGLMPLLQCMGTDITHCGAIGSGQVVKILHNTVLIEAVQSLAEALAVARAHGVEGGVLLDAIELGSADSRASRVQGRQALLPRHYPEGRFATRYALKDVSLALELASMANLDPALARETAGTLRRAIDAGLGDRYYPAIYEVIAATSLGDPKAD